MESEYNVENSVLVSQESSHSAVVKEKFEMSEHNAESPKKTTVTSKSREEESGQEAKLAVEEKLRGNRRGKLSGLS